MNEPESRADIATLSRRTALAVPAFGGLMLLGLRAEAQPEARQPAATPGEWTGFPQQPLALVRDFVGASHGNLAKVESMLKTTPGLVHCAWDWGFGDWETGLGAASHTGNRAIAMILLDHGARLDIFAATMLGMLDVVKGLIAARPGIQKTLGPHHITLLKHAKAGGADAAPVLEFLTAAGGADDAPAFIPIEEAQSAAYAGSYATAGAGPQRFRIYFEKGRLNFQLGDSQPRWLYRVSEHEFFPSGVPSVRMTFALEGGRAKSVSILAPEPALVATRVD